MPWFCLPQCWSHSACHSVDHMVWQLATHPKKLSSKSASQNGNTQHWLYNSPRLGRLRPHHTPNPHFIRKSVIPFFRILPVKLFSPSCPPLVVSIFCTLLLLDSSLKRNWHEAIQAVHWVVQTLSFHKIPMELDWIKSIATVCYSSNSSKTDWIWLDHNFITWNFEIFRNAKVVACKASGKGKDHVYSVEL